MQIKPPWTARFSLDATQTRALIEAQFPQLAPVRLQKLGSGWDNDVWRVNARYTFRFPRRQLAVALLHHERHILPWLLPQLTLPGPTPLFFGEHSDILPAPFAGYLYLEGETACRANPNEATRASHAEPLARFLRGLHTLEVTPTWRKDAPGDVLGRADLLKRVRWFKEQLTTLVTSGLLSPQRAADIEYEVAHLADHTASLHAEQTRWVHGDLYVRHLLLDEHHALAGIIDWGDVHLGDPALDLSIAWTYLPTEARQDFQRVYGATTDASLWDRARLLSLRSGLALLAYGSDIQDADLVREAHRALDAFLE